MPNKHFCQGPHCHTRTTQDRFLKSRGVIRGRYANRPKDDNSGYYDRGKYFCSTNCESLWLDEHMQQWTEHLINMVGHPQTQTDFSVVKDVKWIG